MRAVFYVRGFGKDDPEAVKCLADSVTDKRNSCLYRHEVAYVIGQMQAASALPTLEAVLRDTEDDPIVRHECAEAIAAIGDPSGIPLLEEFCDDARPEVSETCKIGLRSLRWQDQVGAKAIENRDQENPFQSVDPAPPQGVEDGVSRDPMAAAAERAAKVDAAAASTEQLRTLLMDEAAPLFDRYRAMFSLRNRAVAAGLGAGAESGEAVAALVDSMGAAQSALFRHEVAYVLGQLADRRATAGLQSRLEDLNEHPMVRHEAAEALGAIGTPAAEELLRAFLHDKEAVVAESCEVALDAAEYWREEGGKVLADEGE